MKNYIHSLLLCIICGENTTLISIFQIIFLWVRSKKLLSMRKIFTVYCLKVGKNHVENNVLNTLMSRYNNTSEQISHISFFRTCYIYIYMDRFSMHLIPYQCSLLTNSDHISYKIIADACVMKFQSSSFHSKYPKDYCCETDHELERVNAVPMNKTFRCRILIVKLLFKQKMLINSLYYTILLS